MKLTMNKKKGQMMKLTLNQTIARTVVVASMLLTLGVSQAAAGLIEVDQTVFGMDCAPCAYGMEKGLKKLDGVKRVEVSLNKGKAVLELSPGNKLTLGQIRDAVRRSGFTPKDATVSLTGTLKRAGKQLALKVDDITEHPLAASNAGREKWAGLQKLKDGQSVRVRGRVPEEASTPVRIEVLDFSLFEPDGKPE